MILRSIHPPLLIVCFILSSTTIAQAAPIVLFKRGETGQGQSEPFWISVIAVISILVAIILGVIIIYCVRSKRKQRLLQQNHHDDQPCSINNNSKIATRTMIKQENDSLHCNGHIQHHQQPMMINHAGRTGDRTTSTAGFNDASLIIHSDQELESSKRNRLSALFFGQPPPPPSLISQQQQHMTIEKSNEDDDIGIQSTRRKKKKKNNGTWTSQAFASLGRKSVASVQWVGFRGSMDRQPQQNSGLFVVNHHNQHPNNNSE